MWRVVMPISVVGLEFAFKVAAPGTKSVVTAAFLFTVFVGDFFGGLFDGVYDKQLGPGAFFTVQAIVATITAVTVITTERTSEPRKAGLVNTVL